MLYIMVSFFRKKGSRRFFLQLSFHFGIYLLQQIPDDNSKHEKNCCCSTLKFNKYLSSWCMQSPGLLELRFVIYLFEGLIGISFHTLFGLCPPNFVNIESFLVHLGLVCKGNKILFCHIAFF